ncbi:hypothetical protein B296_00055210 [Ensete ventricosum]|uniref:Uncharacterized protein n=1 Tax=Ensete ventricosum TaxID=4639 RepID=A0A426WWM0_ENSVE|nr:hypothetical protein B296_00055210 [Ensete ventricosum]
MGSSPIGLGRSTTKSAQIPGYRLQSNMTTKLNDLTPSFWQLLKSPAVSLTVFLRRSPDVFLASFPIPSVNLLVNSQRAPTTSSNPLLDA